MSRCHAIITSDCHHIFFDPLHFRPRLYGLSSAVSRGTPGQEKKAQFDSSRSGKHFPDSISPKIQFRLRHSRLARGRSARFRVFQKKVFETIAPEAWHRRRALPFSCLCVLPFPVVQGVRRFVVLQPTGGGETQFEIRPGSSRGHFPQRGRDCPDDGTNLQVRFYTRALYPPRPKPAIVGDL